MQTIWFMVNTYFALGTGIWKLWLVMQVLDALWLTPSKTSRYQGLGMLFWLISLHTRCHTSLLGESSTSMELHCGITPGSLCLVTGLCSCSFSLCLFQSVSFCSNKLSLSVTAFLRPVSPFSELSPGAWSWGPLRHRPSQICARIFMETLFATTHNWQNLVTSIASLVIYWFWYLYYGYIRC